MVVTDAAGKVLYVNRAAQQLTGYAAEGLSGRPITEIVAEPQRKALEEVLGKVAEGVQLESFDLQLSTTSGEALTVSVASSSVLAEHRAAVRRAFTGLLQAGGEDAVFGLFARHVPQLCGSPTTRGMIEELARNFARQVEASSDPERAMNNLDRFIRGVGRRRFYYELLLDRPELVPRLTALFAASEYLSAFFATHPRLIEPIFSDPNVLLLSRKELEEAHAQIRADLEREGTRDPAELELDALRLFHNRELINVGLLDLSNKITPAEAESALTEIAEVCLECALAIAAREMERHGPQAPRGEFLVVGMGKLASRELSYGSDLDVIFLYDAPGAGESELVEAQEYYVRLAQKVIWVLRARTAEGVCYEIDARLRPSGNQGLLVTSLGSFARYHERGAQVWERQALLRARPVAGDAQLGNVFAHLRREILLQPVPPDLRQQIHRVRQRMESELARETSRHYDFKTGRGGLLDVEAVVQYLQLRHARDFPDLLEVAPVTVLLERLERVGLIDVEAARILREGWSFLQLLSSRLRIVQNRSISDLDEERADLDSLARSFGYAAQRPSGARRALLDDYRRHTAAIRQVYSKIVQP